MRVALLFLVAAVSAFAIKTFAQGPAAQEYQVIKKTPVGGAGSFDLFIADAEGRKLYIPRGNRVDVFDLDTFKPAGTIAPINGVRSATIDPKAKHGFSGSNPVVMWDTDSLKTIKTIGVGGRPDEILFDPFTQHVLILSHSQPNATVIDSKDGSVLGTIDLGGQPEQGASDGAGKLYFALEDKSKVAVVDSKAMKLIATYELAPSGGAPAGLALDAKNHILFACGAEPATCVVMNADDGKIIATLPIGDGVDAAEFNPTTMEAFVSTRDGKLTVIKETDPKTFTVEQVVQTLQGAKTCTFDAKTGHILLITNDPSVPLAAAPATSPPSPSAGQGPSGPRGRGPAGTFSVIVVGKETK